MNHFGRENIFLRHSWLVGQYDVTIQRSSKPKNKLTWPCAEAEANSGWCIPCDMIAAYTASDDEVWLKYDPLCLAFLVIRYRCLVQYKLRIPRTLALYLVGVFRPACILRFD